MGDIFALARGLGLRIGQVTRLKVGDVRGLHRRDQPTMIRIRPELGKTKQERRGRTVPVAPVVLPTLRRLVAGKKSEDPLFERTGRINNYTLNNIVRRSIARGVRPEVFASLERRNKRKTHYFRAGFISGIQQLGASKKAAQRLVGHQAVDTADGAYDPATLQMLIEAVALVPEIAASQDLPSRVLSLPTTPG